ncbi:MAG: hypothetical protein ABL984_15870 [Pyrinomonadaceae bacterium]
MDDIVFNFEAANSWTMEEACKKVSNNPAPQSHPVLYLIHNQNENTTYAGYAQDARHRWLTRVEVFHCFGMKQDYGKNVLCSMCIPVLSNNANHDGPMHTALNSPEHLLIRAVVKGLLGVTTNTNTDLSEAPYINPYSYNRVIVYLPTKPKWGHLESDKMTVLPHMY